jgi:hypothetical protein
MKTLILISSVIFGSSCFAGNDTGGTVFSNLMAQSFIQAPQINLFINGDAVTGFRTKLAQSDLDVTTTPSVPTFRDVTVPTSLNVFNLKYAGETNQSVFLMLNNQDAAVEIMDSEIQLSDDLMEALRAAAETQQWIQIPKN